MGDYFDFKRFRICQDRCAMKVGTDGVLLGAWAAGGKRILDIGTGTGVVAMMMAQRFPQAEVVGIDIDAAACGQAMENVAASKLNNVDICNSALQDYRPDALFDSIVCNPPYFLDSLKSTDAQRTLARHTDSLSPRDLFKAAYRLLSADGSLSLVLPTHGFDAFFAESIFVGFCMCRKVVLRTTPKKLPKRLLVSFTKQREEVSVSEETLMTADGARSEWYSALTSDFYLDQNKR